MARADEEKLSIWLFVAHNNRDEASHTLYQIQPDLLSPLRSYTVDSNGLMIDKDIYPFLTFYNNKDDMFDLNFLEQATMFHLGSLIYFFGGNNYSYADIFDKDKKDPISDEFKRSVRVLDTNHPELGLQHVAPLNYPKQTPSVFAADGFMYALGAAWTFRGEEIVKSPQNRKTGCFERYDPESDTWVILPDPPLPLVNRVHVNWTGCITVVDRYVCIGDAAIFNLNTQKWISVDRPLFFYGAIYYDRYLYYLRGEGSSPRIYACAPEYDNPLEFVRRGPLPATTRKNLLEAKCLHLEKAAQVIANAEQLDGNDALYTRMGFRPWRKIFHLSDHVFCYVVTTQLLQDFSLQVYEPQCRGVWLKFFKEVKAGDKTEFRLLASFCYKIRTPFNNFYTSIECCVFGSVPEAWVKGLPLKQKLEKIEYINPEQSHHKLEAGNTGCDASLEEKLEKIELIHPEQSHHKLEIAGNTGHDVSLDEEIRKLTAELEEKKRLLNILLAERQGRNYRCDE